MNPLKTRPRVQVVDDQEGLTIIEMVIALTIISTSFLALSFVLFGAIDAFAAARIRSSFVEIANGEIEEIRSLPYESAGVLTTDPNFSTAYPGGQFEGRDPVTVTATVAPAAVSVVSTAPVSGLPVPYTVRRWITWTDATGGAGHVMKRITLQVEWREGDADRSFRLVSIYYPGSLGPPTVGSAPVAVLTASPTMVNAGSSVSFDASGSSDPDGDPLSYSWDFGDGTTYIGAALESHIYSSVGTYTAKVTVLDPHGGFDSEIVNINVGTASGNFAPDAQFSFTPTTGNAPLNVSFDASASSDPNGDPLTYSWNWGDNSSNGSGVNTGHEFATAGTYTVVLTVTDTGGLSDTATGVVVVSELVCEVVSGRFENPRNNPLINDIKVNRANSKPDDRRFTFFATTNLACNQAKGRIQISNGTFFEVTLSQVSSGLTTKTWEGFGEVGSNDSFSLGNQTGEIRARGSTGPENIFTFGYLVHT